MSENKRGHPTTENRTSFLESDEWLKFKEPSKVVIHNSKEHSVLIFRIPDVYIKAIDAEVDQGKYMNRSEFLRDIVRDYFLPPL